MQRRQVEGDALMHGLALDQIVIEEGVRGSVPVAERPAAGPLFAKLSKGDVVIAPKLDRLFRSALDDLQVVAELKALGVALHLLAWAGTFQARPGEAVPDHRRCVRRGRAGSHPRAQRWPPWCH